MRRTLRLRRETLAELPARDLAAVAGGAVPTTPLDVCTANSYFVCTGPCATRGTTCAC